MTISGPIDWERLERLVTRWGQGIATSHIGFANYNENAMRDLNETQDTTINKLNAAYAAYRTTTEAATSFNTQIEAQIKQFLMEEYRKNPAKVQNRELPLDFSHNRHFTQEELKAYYQHPVHTAYRYLFCKPNLWMSPNANHVSRNGRREGTANINPNEKTLIINIWSALIDQSFPLADGYTPENAKNFFIATLANLGRAHNWDQSRWVRRAVKGRDGITRDLLVEEAFDDLEGDKPSCSSGVLQRLSQFVMLALKQNPNERSLYAKDIVDKFREEMLSLQPGKNTVFNAIEKMDKERLKQLKNALDKLCVYFDRLEPEEQALLRQLQCYNTRDLETLLQKCIEYYGEIRLTKKLNAKVKHQHLSFDNYGQLLLYLAKDPWSIYYNQINEKIDDRILILEEEEALRQKVVEYACNNNDLPLSNKAIEAPIEELRTTWEKIQEEDQALRQQVIDYGLEYENQAIINRGLGPIEEVKSTLAEIQTMKRRTELRKQLEVHAEEAHRQQTTAVSQVEERKKQQEATARQIEQHIVDELLKQQEEAVRSAQKQGQEASYHDVLQTTTMLTAYTTRNNERHDEYQTSRSRTGPQVAEQKKQQEAAARQIEQRIVDEFLKQQEETVRLAQKKG